MGQTLSEPIVDKSSEKGEDERMLYGVSAMQGWRIGMEDAHTTVLNLLENEPEEAKAHGSKISFFGVFDGHGGDKVALFAGDNIHRIVAKQEAFKKGNYDQALKDGFLATDRAILNGMQVEDVDKDGNVTLAGGRAGLIRDRLLTRDADPKYEEEVSGCTACAGLITDDKIYLANAGDSRSVLGVKGRAKPLSFDHKPQNDGEKARITAAGGFVDFGRVNGNLALSRAIGDFEFKKSAELAPEQQIVTAYPDVTIHDLTDNDEFLVIACDGIWDCQSSQAVVEFVRRGIAAKQDLEKICENMMDNCLASNSETGGVGCDNMTMVIVGFLRGRSKEEWYDEIARRVANGDGPCAPPEYAEFRGPGVHHNFDDSDSGYDMEQESRSHTFGIGGYNGRIILLGDGSEVLTDSDDTEMFDREDLDLDSQVSKASTASDETANKEAAPVKQEGETVAKAVAAATAVAAAPAEAAVKTESSTATDSAPRPEAAASTTTTTAPAADKTS